MVDNYCVVPNRKERRTKPKFTISGKGVIGVVNKPSQKANNVKKNKQTMKEFVKGRIKE